MPNYLVISYDPDEQQDLWDIVDARSKKRAEEIVYKTRSSHIPGVSCVLTSGELREIAGRLDTVTSSPKNVRDLRRSIEP